MAFPFVSVTVVVRFCCTPWVMVPLVAPLARVTSMLLGGQVLKYPAEEPDPAIEAVMAVVPGFSAVIWLLVLSIFATDAVPTLKLITPIADSQVGICDRFVPGGNSQAGVVVPAGAHSNCCLPSEL